MNRRSSEHYIVLLLQDGCFVMMYSLKRWMHKESDMTKWTMAQAKRDFEIGYLSGVRFWRSIADGEPWTVGLEGGSARGHLVDARSKQVREFKTLDAAIRAAEEIGFEVKALTIG